MCSVTAGLMAVATLLGARAQQQQAKAQASAARAQAAAAEENARIENRKQETIADKYAQEDIKRRAQARLSAGHNQANAGAASLSAEAGTSVWDILSSSEEQFQNDRNISLTNQRNDNYNSRIVETNYINQANAYRQQADKIEAQSKWNTFSTILGSAAAISGNISSGGSSKGTSSSYSGSDNFTSVSSDYNGGSLNFNKTSGISFKSKYSNTKNPYSNNGAFF